MAKLQMGTPNERWHQGTGRTYQDREHAGTGGLGAHGTLRRPELHLLFPFVHHRIHFSVKYDTYRSTHPCDQNETYHTFNADKIEHMKETCEVDEQSL